MEANQVHSEQTFRPLSAWPVLTIQLATVFGLIVLGVALKNPLVVPLIGAAVIFVVPGYFVVSPNLSRVLILFGHYRGTVRENGFFWTNPFTVKKKVSLRAHNQNGERLKVNDLAGNPIEIAAVVVWQVCDTARAVFDVEDFTHFVSVQSEAALRSLASQHPYDEGQHDNVRTTLRGSAEEVAGELQVALQQRLDQAGVKVVEARLSHLAYAQEIASAMLQRQQAAAIIAARQKIVEGAVGMVEMALEQLESGGKIQLDDERRATLVGNLLVVLCAHENPQPVLNTGSLYS